MNAETRQQQIVDLLAEEGRVSVADLARRFAVSDDTIRRDLTVLEGEGVVSKRHGAAVALDVPAMARGGRSRILAPVKRQLGAAAAALVRPGMTLMLDAGETILAVAQALPPGDLTVITHSLDVALLLSSRPGTRLIVAGGTWNPRQRLLEGSAAEALVASCRADLAFLGACSADPVRGVTATDAGDAGIKQAMVAAAARRILVADHTKVGGLQPWLVAPWASFDEFFTDRPLTWEGPGPLVRVVPPEGDFHGS